MVMMVKSPSVADIYGKMAAERSELEGSNDGGRRRGQQLRQLWLRCDFVAASGIGCSKGAAAIRGRRGSGVRGYYGGGKRRYGAIDNYCHVQFIAGCNQDSWQRKIAEGCNIDILQ
ncbi:hypothetical protein BHE74_00033392 [Ensete ventricosum]|nr:hypothetical protein GW17_00024735 [Ensete ventricosum]RWW59659.1 hypothetical protein BHE74_00033392 [Ensete ventricosum]RZS08337.1 hypothetical protein BHM03_00039292 [Ensete ventricosum]